MRMGDDQMVEWQASDSSALTAYRYLAEQELLEVVFSGGHKIYDFHCPARTWEAFRRAPSKGKFISTELE